MNSAMFKKSYIDFLEELTLKAISGKELKSILHYFTVISARAPLPITGRE